MLLCSNYESKTVTTFLQDYYTKGKMERQVLYAKASEGHTREVVNNWDVLDVSGTVKFPRLLDTISVITDIDQGTPYAYGHKTAYSYDSYFNVGSEQKYHWDGQAYVLDIGTFSSF